MPADPTRDGVDGLDGAARGAALAGGPGVPLAQDSAARIAELEDALDRRTQQLAEARRALDRAFLDDAAAPVDGGSALSVRLHGIVRELQRVSEELEERNAALASANWRLEHRVAERTAALQAALDAKRDNEARFRRVAEGVPQLVWTSHPEGRWDYANRRWTAYTGQTEAETHGLGWLNSVHPDDRDRTMQAWHTASVTGERFFVEHRLRGRDGSWRWFETQALPTGDGGLDGSGDAQWVGSSSDIHARKVAEQELRDAAAALQKDLARNRQELAESEARFRAYFQITPEPLFLVIAAPDGRFLHEAFNQPFERLTGLHEDEAKGREAGAFMPAATAAVFEEHYRLCVGSDLPHMFDALVALPAGDRMLRVTLVPTLGRGDAGHDAGDGPTGDATKCLFGSVRDMSNAPGTPVRPNLDA